MRGKMRSAKALMELCNRLSHDGKFQVMFVSDPTQGYGVFIDWMLQQSDALSDRQPEAA